ncbi:hypothetical protein KI387_024451, partial [Taxus chinensis]
VPKLLLHRLFPNVQYSLWIDGKLELVVDPYQILERVLTADPDSGKTWLGGLFGVVLGGVVGDYLFDCNITFCRPQIPGNANQDSVPAYRHIGYWYGSWYAL